MRSRSKISLVYDGWHNFKVNYITATLLESFYVFFPSWWGSLETSIPLLVPTSPILEYYSKLAKESARGMKVVI